MRPHTKRHRTFVSTNRSVFCANQAFMFLTLPFLIVRFVFKVWHLIHSTSSQSISHLAYFVVSTGCDLGVRVFIDDQDINHTFSWSVCIIKSKSNFENDRSHYGKVYIESVFMICYRKFRTEPSFSLHNEQLEATWKILQLHYRQQWQQRRWTFPLT